MLVQDDWEVNQDRKVPTIGMIFIPRFTLNVQCFILNYLPGEQSFSRSQQFIPDRQEIRHNLRNLKVRFPVGRTRYTSSHASCGQDPSGSQVKADICIHAAGTIYSCNHALQGAHYQKHCIVNHD